MVNRPVHDQATFDTAFDHHVAEPKPCCQKMSSACRKHCECSCTCITKKILGFFPFIEVLRTYQIKKFLLSDIIAGLSVGIVHIPQSMGFSMLGSLPPVYGLHASFWQPLVFFFFTTSRHTSFATMAVVSLILSAAIEREMLLWTPPSSDAAGLLLNVTANATNANDIINHYDNRKVAIATTVCLLAGLFQLVMGAVGFGALTRIMPSSFVSGFTTACGVYIGSSQAKHLFGIKPKRSTGMFQFIKTWINIFKNLSSTNIATLVISILSILVLVFIKEFVNEKYKARLPTPIPAELFVVIIATLCSYLAHFADRYNVTIIGEIPRGIAVPEIPPMDIAPNVIVDAILVAILSFVISVSVANVFTKKYKYSVDSNQELMAYGMSHTVSSFFHCLPGASAPPRCFVFDTTGGKTTVAHLFSCMLLLLVILVIAPLFAYLPTAVLGSVIIIALLPLFRQFGDLKLFWKISKIDFYIWLVVWGVTVFLDITLGLVIGIVFILLAIVVQAQFAKGHNIGRVGSADLYVPMDTYSKSENIKGISIFHFDSSLYFSTAQCFKQWLNKLVGSAQSFQNKDNTGEEAQADGIYMDENYTEMTSGHQQNVSMIKADRIHTLIIDCSNWTFIDAVGLNVVEDIHADYKLAGINVVLAACSQYLRDKLAAFDLTGEGLIALYPTIADAVEMSIVKHNNLPKSDLANESS